MDTFYIPGKYQGYENIMPSKELMRKFQTMVRVSNIGIISDAPSNIWYENLNKEKTNQKMRKI